MRARRARPIRRRARPWSARARAPASVFSDRRTSATSFLEISCELGEEAQIAIVEKSQVVYPVTQHRQPIGTHAESETHVLLVVYAAGLEHVGVHLTAAGYLKPTGLPAYPAARTAAKYAAHVDFGRRLGEREKRRPKARSQLLVFEELAQEIGENAFEIGEAHRLVDPKTLHLVEHRRVGRVRIDAVHPARRDDLERRLVMLHVAHLDRRGVRAQKQALPGALQIERVVHRTRGVVLRLIERSEVVEVGLDLGTVRHVEPDRAKKLLDALERACRRVQAAADWAVPRQSHVQRLFGEPRIELGAGQRLAAGSERRLDPVLGGIDARPGFAAGPGCKLGEALHRPREGSRFSEVTRLDALELVRVVRAAELGDRTRNNFIQIDHLSRLPRRCAPPFLGRTGFSVLRAEFGLCLARELRESGFVNHGQVREHLAIDFDRSLLQTVHESRVCHAVLAHGRVDARDPESAKLALALLAVTVGILPRLHHRFLGDVENIAATAAESLGLSDDFLVLGARGYAAFDSWHDGSPLRVREHRADMLLVRSVHLRSSAQMAFVLGGFLGEDVALERLRALDAPTGADLEALGRAALGLHFGHCTAPVLAWRRVAPTERFPTSAPLLLEPAVTLGRNLRFRFLLGFFLGFLFHRLLDFLLALLRGQHHDQLPPFHLRILLHDRVRLEILLHPFDQPHAKFLMRHLSAAIAQSDLGLVAFIQELDQVAQLDLVVTFVGSGTEFYLFDVDLLLLELGFVSFLRLAVLELAVVHQLADGRLGKRSDFHQIDLGLLGHFQGLGDRHDADLLAGGSDQAHFGRVDLDVDALRSLRGDVASSRKLKTKPHSPLWPRCGGGRRSPAGTSARGLHRCGYARPPFPPPSPFRRRSAGKAASASYVPEFYRLFSRSSSRLHSDSRLASGRSRPRGVIALPFRNIEHHHLHGR